LNIQIKNVCAVFFHIFANWISVSFFLKILLGVCAEHVQGLAEAIAAVCHRK